MLKSYGNLNKDTNAFDFMSLRKEEMQFWFNNFRLELKDHNRAQINPGFVSHTLVDKDFQHTINSLHFLIKGSAILNFEGKKYQLNEGDVFLLGNHVKCFWEYTSISEELTFLFNAYMGNLNDLFTDLKKPLVLKGNYEDTNRIDELFYREDNLSVFILRNMCLKYLEKFLSMTETDFTEHIKVVKKYEDVFKYITENLSVNLKIDELCKATNYSIGFFTKSFSKDNGITVKQYIHDKIMSDVEQMLIYSDLTIREISDKYEFCEQAYFTRWFKKYKNCTPMEYRNTIRNITENKGRTI